MSRINYRRRDTWKIKMRKPISIRPARIMDETRYERRHIKHALHELLKGVMNETSSE